MVHLLFYQPRSNTQYFMFVVAAAFNRKRKQDCFAHGMIRRCLAIAESSHAVCIHNGTVISQAKPWLIRTQQTIADLIVSKLQSRMTCGGGKRYRQNKPRFLAHHATVGSHRWHLRNAAT